MDFSKNVGLAELPNDYLKIFIFWFVLLEDDDASLTSSPSTTHPQQQQNSQQFHFRNVVAEGCLLSDKNGNDFRISSIDADLIVLEEVNGGIEHDFGDGIFLSGCEKQVQKKIYSCVFCR